MIKITTYLLRILSIFSLIYCFILIFYSGRKTSFLWFYIAFPIAATVISIILPLMYKSQIKAAAICGTILLIGLWTTLLLFFIVEIRILTFSSTNPPENAEYVIVLGAQVRGSTPSLALQNRIFAAYDYLVKNPETKVICSGGQGVGEDISEAFAISKMLMELGISEDRIILEDQSTNTTENLLFSSEFIRIESDTVIVVSNDFHVYRACKIAKKTGIEHVYGYSKREFLFTTPGYYIREFFAVCKDFLFGNM